MNMLDDISALFSINVFDSEVLSVLTNQGSIICTRCNWRNAPAIECVCSLFIFQYLRMFSQTSPDTKINARQS